MSVDFPRAWQIAGEVDKGAHHPKCSYAYGLLCDCDVLTKNPEYLSKDFFGKDGVLIRSDLDNEMHG
jgi:hypothetical protein